MLVVNLDTWRCKQRTALLGSDAGKEELEIIPYANER